MVQLAQPITIGTLTVKNRIVRSATQDFLGNADGTISEAENDLYETLAKHQVGMIITAHSYVQHPLGRASVNQNAIYSDHFIAGYQALAERVHRHGAALILQISHAGRQTPPNWVPSLTPVAPSAVTDGSTGITPREMNTEEIWETIDSFAAAMLRAKKANCDGVQLHIAHGYLLSQFLSPFTNRRSDEWGGSLENRTRILREILIRGRQAVGPDYPVLAKLNTTDGLTGPAYLSLKDAVSTAKMLEAYGLTAIEVSGGIREAKGVMSKPAIRRAEDEAYFAEAAKAVKQAVSIPVILVGGLRSQAVINRVLSDGAADMAAFSRPFVRQPDLAEKLLRGEAAASCISCNACFNPQGLRCYMEGK